MVSSCCFFLEGLEVMKICFNLLLWWGDACGMICLGAILSAENQVMKISLGYKIVYSNFFGSISLKYVFFWYPVSPSWKLSDFSKNSLRTLVFQKWPYSKLHPQKHLIPYKKSQLPFSCLFQSGHIWSFSLKNHRKWAHTKSQYRCLCQNLRCCTCEPIRWMQWI